MDDLTLNSLLTSPMLLGFPADSSETVRAMNSVYRT